MVNEKPCGEILLTLESSVWKAGLNIAAANTLGCETNITQAKGISVKYK